MDSTSLVSIVIPAYNRPETAARAVRSILNQTYQNFEIIVTDDSSNDGVKKAMEAINDSRIKYHHNQERLGFVENKNQGVRLSDPHSAYIAFLDDDDEYLPTFLEKTVGALEKDPEAVAAATSAELRRQDNSFVKTYQVEKDAFWRTSLGNGCVVRRDIFFGKGIWFDKCVLFEDLDFGVRVTQGRRWITIPEALRIYYGYPAESGQSNSTSYTKATPTEKLEAFWNKDKSIYEAAGPEAVAWAKTLTGKWLMRAGHSERGRMYLREALASKFSFGALFFYLMALLFPASFRSINAMVWKNKITGFFSR